MKYGCDNNPRQFKRKPDPIPVPFFFEACLIYAYLILWFVFYSVWRCLFNWLQRELFRFKSDAGMIRKWFDEGAE